MLRQLATPHASGLHLLAAPADAVEAAYIDDEIISRILTLARRTYDYVIVDSFPMLDRVMMAVLDLSDQAYIVLESVVPTLLGGAKLLKLLDELGVSSERVRVVLNRYMNFAGNLKPSDVVRLLGRPVDHVIPYKKGVVISANLGRPYILRAGRFFGFGRAVTRLIDEVADVSSILRNGRTPIGSNGVAGEHGQTDEVSLMSNGGHENSNDVGATIARAVHALEPLGPHVAADAQAAPGCDLRRQARVSSASDPAWLGDRGRLSGGQGRTPSAPARRVRRAEPDDGASEEVLAAAVREFVDRVLATEDLPLNDQERKRLADDLTEETLGVGPLAPLMADPSVTDILVNRFNQVYVERFGKLAPTDVRFRNDEHLVRIIQRIAARVGRRIDEASPMVDARLPDGSRVNATIPPVTLDGPTLSIRRFGRQRLRREDLLQDRHALAEHGRLPRAGRRDAEEHPDLRRHRRGQVHLPRRGRRGDPRTTSGSSRSRTRPS